MKLLFITQKIDKDDDILGVYHEWAREIAKSFEKLSVICLHKGKNELPDVIRIFSLGKEKNADSRGFESGFTRMKYLKNFFFYVWAARNDYDAVFVHMNPIYVLLGWFMWRILGKKIYLWYAHPGWNLRVKLAYILCDKVITSVPEAFHVREGKVAAIGQGIDTEKFPISNAKFQFPSSILYLGRISPSKNIHILLQALSILKNNGVTFGFTLVGSAPDVSEAKEYEKNLGSMIFDLGLSDISEVHASVPYGETVHWYNKSEIFVNLSPTGHFDKTVLEAMASGCIALASNDAYYNVFPRDLHEFLMFRHCDPKDLAEKVKKVFELPNDKKEEIQNRLREIVVKHHSIYTLGERLRKAMKSA